MDAHVDPAAEAAALAFPLTFERANRPGRYHVLAGRCVVGQVAKVAPRRWHSLLRGEVEGTFRSRREAGEHRRQTMAAVAPEIIVAENRPAEPGEWL